MTTSLLLEGEDLEALLVRAHQEGGDHARIVRAEKVRQGGFLGFFAREHFEVAVEIPEMPPPSSVPEAGSEARSEASPRRSPISYGPAGMPTGAPGAEQGLLALVDRASARERQAATRPGTDGARPRTGERLPAGNSQGLRAQEESGPGVGRPGPDAGYPRSRSARDVPDSGGSDGSDDQPEFTTLLDRLQTSGPTSPGTVIGRPAPQDTAPAPAAGAWSAPVSSAGALPSLGSPIGRSFGSPLSASPVTLAPVPLPSAARGSTATGSATGTRPPVPPVFLPRQRSADVSGTASRAASVFDRAPRRSTTSARAGGVGAGLGSPGAALGSRRPHPGSRPAASVPRVVPYVPPTARSKVSGLSGGTPISPSGSGQTGAPGNTPGRAPVRTPVRASGRTTGSAADRTAPVAVEAHVASTNSDGATLAAGLHNDLRSAADRRRLRSLGVPVAWTRQLRGGDRFAAVLRMMERMPEVDVDPEASVVAVVGPVGLAVLEAHRTAVELAEQNRPRPVVCVPTTALGGLRGSALAQVHREPCVVAVEVPDNGSVSGIREVLEAVDAQVVVLCVDATNPLEGLQRWLDGLDQVDALVVTGACTAREPMAVLQLGLPVVRLDGIPVDRVTWTAVLCARLEAMEPVL